MTEYLQVHGLASYPASLPNRDRDGEPKQIMMGNVLRGRISSQCLKRNWRISDLFTEEFGALGEKNLGLRTKELGGLVYDRFLKGGLAAEKAEQWTLVLGAVFGVMKPEKKDTMDHLKNETLFFLSPEEHRALDAYVDKIVAEKLEAPVVKGKEAMEKEAAKIRSKILKRDSTAVDLAMFGRMFAQDKSFSVDAAVQVAHAFTVHGMDVEEDFFTAVDDVKERGDTDEDRGGGHLGNSSLEAGVFYLYASINVSALKAHLKDDALTAKACQVFVKAMATVFPKAKGNSCAQQSRAYFMRVERGTQAPRNLSLAFLDPVGGRSNVGPTAVQRLLETVTSIDTIYGQCWDKSAQFNVFSTNGSQGSMKDLLELAGGTPS